MVMTAEGYTISDEGVKTEVPPRALREASKLRRNQIARRLTQALVIAIEIWEGHVLQQVDESKTGQQLLRACGWQRIVAYLGQQWHAATEILITEPELSAQASKYCHDRIHKKQILAKEGRLSQSASTRPGERHGFQQPCPHRHPVTAEIKNKSKNTNRNTNEVNQESG